MRFIFFGLTMFLSHGIRKPIIIVDLARILRSEIRTYKFKISPCTVLSIFILIMNDCSSIRLWLCSHTAVVVLARSQKKREKTQLRCMYRQFPQLTKIYTHTRTHAHARMHWRSKEHMDCADRQKVIRKSLVSTIAHTGEGRGDRMF